MNKSCSCCCHEYAPVHCHECCNGTSRKWIGVKDKLPPECENILIYTKGMIPISAFLIYSKEGKPLGYKINDWDESDQDLRLDEITHWMPLPELPNKE